MQIIASCSRIEVSAPSKAFFSQLRELTAKYPKLKILLSIGNWTFSKYFSLQPPRPLLAAGSPARVSTYTSGATCQKALLATRHQVGAASRRTSSTASTSTSVDERLEARRNRFLVLGQVSPGLS